MDVSVIIPVYNDPGGLKTTVNSLLSQGYEDYEVIIADNGSTDGTGKIAQKFERNGFIHHVIEDEVQSSYAARNAGIEAAQGEIICFLDADMWVDPDYLELVVDRMPAKNRSCMGCSVEIVGGEGLLTKYNRATGFPIESYINDAGFIPTNCLIAHKNVFDAVGKFDNRLISSGDVVFGRKVRQEGFDLIYEPDITVYHPARTSFQELLSKSIRIGRGREQARRYGVQETGNRSILHPRNYLPPDPFYFYRTTDVESATKTQIIMWYLLKWIFGWCTTFGRIQEYASPTENDNKN